MVHYPTFVILPSPAAGGPGWATTDPEIEAAVEIVMTPFAQFLSSETRQAISKDDYDSCCRDNETEPPENQYRLEVVSNDGLPDTYFVHSSINFASLYDYYLVGCIEKCDGPIRPENKLKCKYISPVTALLHFRPPTVYHYDDGAKFTTTEIWKPSYLIDASVPTSAPAVISAFAPKPAVISAFAPKPAVIDYPCDDAVFHATNQMIEALSNCDPRCIVVVLDMHS